MPTSLTYEYKIELLYRKVMTSIKLLSRHRNRKQIYLVFFGRYSLKFGHFGRFRDSVTEKLVTLVGFDMYFESA